MGFCGFLMVEAGTKLAEAMSVLEPDTFCLIYPYLKGHSTKVAFFWNVFPPRGGESKNCQNKKKSISDSAHQKLSGGVIKKNPWSDPLTLELDFNLQTLKRMRV